MALAQSNGRNATTHRPSMKTRTTRSTKCSVNTEAEAVEVTKSTAPKVQLGPDVANPPQLFILPDDLSSEARIVSLQHPRHGKDSRYVACPQTGFYEFTKIAAPKATPRSWLLTPEDLDDAADGKIKIKSKRSIKGYVTKGADLLIATPVDPLFLLLPALGPPPTTKDSTDSKKLFLSAEDYIERIESASPGVRIFLNSEAIRTSLECRMATVCDTVDAGNETMFRLDEGKLVQQLLQKARSMITDGLPASLEEKFVRKTLEKPLLSKRRDDTFEDGTMTRENLSTPDSDDLETQTTLSSVDTSASSFSEASTAATSFSVEELVDKPRLNPKRELPTIDAPSGVAHLLRIRTVLSFICSNYVQPHLTAIINEKLCTPSDDTNFEPLDTHLVYLASLRKEALASRALGNNSRKRCFEDDDEDGGEAESRAEKKRKKEEEEKRKKAGESRGVKNLKKVNVAGMKKMSDFFKKK